MSPSVSPSCVSQSPRSDARCFDAGSGVDAVTLAPSPGSGVVAPACPCLDARCCDAGSGVVLPFFVTLALAGLGSCLPLVSLYLDARCCDAGSAVGCQML